MGYKRSFTNFRYPTAACTAAALNRTYRATGATYPVLGEIEGSRLTSVSYRGQIPACNLANRQLKEVTSDRSDFAVPIYRYRLNIGYF